MIDEILFRRFGLLSATTYPVGRIEDYLLYANSQERLFSAGETGLREGERLPLSNIAPRKFDFFGPDIEEKRRQEILSRKFSLDEEVNWRHRYDLFCHECGAEEVYMMPFGKHGGEWIVDEDGNEKFVEIDRVPLGFRADNLHVEATLLWCKRCGYIRMQECARVER